MRLDHVVGSLGGVWYMHLKTENCCLKTCTKHPFANSNAIAKTGLVESNASKNLEGLSTTLLHYLKGFVSEL